MDLLNCQPEVLVVTGSLVVACHVPSLQLCQLCPTCPLRAGNQQNKMSFHSNMAHLAMVSFNRIPSSVPPQINPFLIVPHISYTDHQVGIIRHPLETTSGSLPHSRDIYLKSALLFCATFTGQFQQCLLKWDLFSTKKAKHKIKK